MQTARENIEKALIKNHIIQDIDDIIGLQEIEHSYSNYVYIVNTKSGEYFCKYAEPRTKKSYISEPVSDRLKYEFEAVSLIQKYIKNTVKIPNIFFYDSDYCVLCTEVVPTGYELLSDLLLAGKIYKNIGIKLGESLGHIHAATYGIDTSLLSDKTCLKKIRIPLTYSNMGASQEIQKMIDLLSEDLIKNEICIVHSDFKPNNIFVDKNGQIIIVDFEFSHIGDPAAECGFFIGIYIHYIFAYPEKKYEYFRVISDFWEAYKRTFEKAGEKGFEKRVVQHTGVQLLVRLDGAIKFPSSQHDDNLKQLFRSAAEKIICGKIATLGVMQKLFN